MPNLDEDIISGLHSVLTKLISETNGIGLSDTLDLAIKSMILREQPQLLRSVQEFKMLLSGFEQDTVEIDTLLKHPVSDALFLFLKSFPLPYKEEHIHLTGSLTADFIYPRLKKLLSGPKKKIYEKKIIEVYGKDVLPINSVEDVDELIRLKDNEAFERYLKILLLPKLILTSKKAHEDAAYHMAKDCYEKYNVGFIRLKFSITRDSAKAEDAIPGLEKLTPEDVVLGLYNGFKKFQKECPHFKFILSPSFRKEAHFYDPSKYESKKEHFLNTVTNILKLTDKYPELKEVLNNVDTVGDEKNLYRKGHFDEMRLGFRKLQYMGFKIRSHHGEIWKTLIKGVQAVDNAMNIWHIDTLEHGLSLGINPNFYFHMLFERVMESNYIGKALPKNGHDYQEIMDLQWEDKKDVRDKLIKGEKLSSEEILIFIKTKFHTAREVEHYQHDVLNRMIHKNVSLVALPSSNNRLTSFLPDYKDHPFSWWEKKGVKLGVGTDNYVTLNTNFIREMIILLLTDAHHLKITKLLMVTTGEARRPLISQLLWNMRASI